MIKETEITVDYRDILDWRKFRRAAATGKTVKDWKFCFFILRMLKKKGYIVADQSL